ncbi:MAG: ADOP family duplicated permease [Chlamydiota bacterium]
MRFAAVLDRLFRRSRLDQDMEEEMRAHMAERTADLQRRGLPPAEAERRARIEFGGVENYKEQCRETRRFHPLHGFVEDVRFGWRMLCRTPGVSLLALLCLTVGIGANAAVWSWIEGILLRPFPAVVHQERMMAVSGTYRGAASEATDVSWPDFRDLRERCTLFDAFIVDKIMSTTLDVGDRAQRAVGSIVSSNYFDALGVRPILGRGFLPEEEVGRNSHPVTVISYRLWQDRFHGDPAIIGKTQQLNGLPHTVVGVAPPGFNGTFVGWAIQFWVPVSMQETFDPTGYKLDDRASRWIEGFVMLKSGVTPQQAQNQISAVAARLEAAYPDSNRGRGIKLFPLWKTPFNNAGTLLPTLGIALAVVVFVLLIACANVSNLLLSRGVARRHEMTVRLAVGAKRGRLLRQLLTEALVLSTLAVTAGLLFGYWCRNLLVLLLPSRGGREMNFPGQLDWRVLSLSAVLCLVATGLFGVVPAIQASRVDLAGAIKAESASVVGGRRRGLTRWSLVLVQIALSFALLVGAALLLQSLRNLQNMSPGFSTRDVLVTGIDLKSAGYDQQRTREFEDQLLDRLSAVPGVASASFAEFAPFSYVTYASAPVAIEGFANAPGELPTLDYNQVGPGYVATMGIPLLSGREFTRADNEAGPPVAIINESMAAQYWRGRDLLGSRFQFNGRWLRVIGVAKDSKYSSLNEPPTPFFYVPLRQGTGGTILNIRTSLPPQAMALTLAREVHALDQNLAPGEVLTMGEQVARTMAPQRVALMLLTVFSILALLLAAIGMYGVMSYTVSQSRRELGLRMALGAEPRDLLRLVMSHGLALTAAGVALGAALTLGSSRLLGYLLYRVSPRDPLAFISALTIMTLAALAACLVPAVRAARTDPVRALRS